jgi:hypothetical protein
MGSLGEISESKEREMECSLGGQKSCMSSLRFKKKMQNRLNFKSATVRECRSEGVSFHSDEVLSTDNKDGKGKMLWGVVGQKEKNQMTNIFYNCENNGS